MIDTLSSQPWNQVEEVLRLECPGCGGMLNLQRRFLGVEGQCVHCQIPLVALEEGGIPRASSDAVTFSEKASAIVSHGAVPAFSDTFPVLREDSSTSASEVVASFPDFPDFPDFGVSGFGACPSNRDGEPLFSGRKELPNTAPPVGGTNTHPPRVGAPGRFPLSFSPSESDAEEPAAIGSFSSSSFDGDGLRTPELPVAAPGSNHDPRAVVAPHGGWHPIKQTSRGERNGFAVHPFGPDNARTKTTRSANWRSRALHFVAFLCLVGAFGAGGSFFVPQETRSTWKKGMARWLEPGMTLLDYLPSSLRPERLTLPQPVSNADAGGRGRPKGRDAAVADP
jgi:hypothetical protein